jgi:Zn-dependent peptidase ImmA (M78 family)
MVLIPREKYIKAKALSFLKKYKVKMPPVPLESIVKSEGISALYYFEPGFGAGTTVRKGNEEYFIHLSISGSQEWDTWNLAVQFGHIALGHFRLFDIDTMTKDKLSEKDREMLNREAKIFAKEILMPDYLVKRLDKKLNKEELSAALFVPVEYIP